MRAISAPTEAPNEVFQICVASIQDIDLRSRLTALTNDISNVAGEYQQRAVAKQLYTLPPNNCGNDDIVLGAATKRELKELYSSHMVRRGKPAREIYDFLLSRAPLGRCPLCGMGYASTLDHYLPKSKYPQLSVVPLNLVPSCKDCNTGKSILVASTEDAQSLHPYFDNKRFVDEQWLFAEVVQSTPATIRYYVQAPISWDDVSQARVQAHFKDFKLGYRYSLEASNQIACLRETLFQYRERLGREGVKQHLMVEAHAYSSLHKNSWQTAMFQALSKSVWYCEGGFL